MNPIISSKHDPYLNESMGYRSLSGTNAWIITVNFLIDGINPCNRRFYTIFSKSNPLALYRLLRTYGGDSHRFGEVFHTGFLNFYQSKTKFKNHLKQPNMKKNKIIFWTTTVIIFLFEGLMPLGTLLFTPEYATVGTKPLGYPDYFAHALIICKMLGATALMIPSLHPKIREWAYAGLTFNLIFAVISHAVVDGEIANIAFPFIIGSILAVSYIYGSKIRINGKMELTNIPNLS